MIILLTYVIINYTYALIVKLDCWCSVFFPRFVVRAAVSWCYWLIASYRYVCRSRFDAVKLQDGTTVLFLVYVTNYFTILFIFTIRSYVPSNLTSLTSLYATYIYTASFSSFFILGTFFSDSFHGRGMGDDKILRVYFWIPSSSSRIVSCFFFVNM